LGLLAVGIAAPASAQSSRPAAPAATVPTDSIRISGRLVGADGAPASVSHAHLQAWGGDSIVASARVAPDGSFTLRTDARGALLLWLSAVGHAGERVGLLLDGQTSPLRVEARLASHDWREDPGPVMAVVRGGDGEEVPMRRDEAGVWTASLPARADADTVSFQATGLAWSGPVEGTGAGRYAYDGAGGYRAVVRVGPDGARAVVDPAELPRTTTLAAVGVTPDETAAGRFAAFSRDLFAHVDAYFDRRARAEAGGATLAELRRIYEEYDPAPAAATLAAHLSRTEDPGVRAWMTAAYLAAPIKTDPAAAREALASIPPASDAWSIDPRALPEALVPSGRPDAARAYASAVADAHPDPAVRAIAVGALLDDALRRDDAEALAALFDRLVTEHPDSKQAARARELYAPDRRIQPGRPVPEFEVASMDDPPVAISRESLRGRTYLMDFWATWCGPCITEMPYLHAARSRFGALGFEILSLSFDLAPEDVTRFRQEGEWTMPWLHTFVAEGMVSTLADDFDIVNIPRAILVGPDGRIVATNEDLRGERLAQTLSRVLEDGRER
jgi:thiol-disulfide isomerase/thioredoxin